MEMATAPEPPAVETAPAPEVAISAHGAEEIETQPLQDEPEDEPQSDLWALTAHPEVQTKSEELARHEAMREEVQAMLDANDEPDSSAVVEELQMMLLEIDEAVAEAEEELLALVESLEAGDGSGAGAGTGAGAEVPVAPAAAAAATAAIVFSATAAAAFQSEATVVGDAESFGAAARRVFAEKLADSLQEHGFAGGPLSAR
jgi:hypothetical protein